MDLIKACARAFQSLLIYEYHFVIGRKGKMKEFYLRFDKADFHHLLGLHKLKDIAQIQQGKREKIFDKILCGEITEELVRKSSFYHQMKDRIIPLAGLENMLDEKEQMCRTFFRVGDVDYTQGQPQYTLLKKEKRNLVTGEAVVQYDKLKNVSNCEEDRI